MRHEPSSAVATAHTSDHRVLHALESSERSLDLDGVDALAPHLHASVEPPKYLKDPIRAEPTKITGSQGGSLAAVHELGFGQLRVAPVARRDVGSAHHDLSRLAGGRSVTGVVDDLEVVRGQHPACRQPTIAGLRSWRHLIDGHGAGFLAPIGVDQASRRERMAQRSEITGREFLTAEREVSQAGDHGPTTIHRCDQRMKHRRRCEELSDPLIEQPGRHRVDPDAANVIEAGDRTDKQGGAHGDEGS